MSPYVAYLQGLSTHRQMECRRISPYVAVCRRYVAYRLEIGVLPIHKASQHSSTQADRVSPIHKASLHSSTQAECRLFTRPLNTAQHRQIECRLSTSHNTAQHRQIKRRLSARPLNTAQHRQIKCRLSTRPLNTGSAAGQLGMQCKPLPGRDKQPNPNWPGHLS